MEGKGSTPQNDSTPKKNKIVFLGNQGVGKTSILHYFIQGIFTDEYTVFFYRFINKKPTIGLDYSSKTVEENGISVRLQLWDTAGQERFRSMTSQYVNGAAGAIIVFDCSGILRKLCKIKDKSTFESIGFWVQEVRKQRQYEAKIYIVGNKIDLPNEQKYFLSLNLNKKKEK